jgi:hypothetical protein
LRSYTLSQVVIAKGKVARMARTRRTLQIGEHGLPLALTAIVAWMFAALTIRMLPSLFESRLKVVLLCAAMIVASELLLRLGGAVLGIDASKRVPPAAWFAAMLLLCHALAQLFWPSLYGHDETIVRHGSAWLMIAAICPILNARYAAERG